MHIQAIGHLCHSCDMGWTGSSSLAIVCLQLESIIEFKLLLVSSNLCCSKRLTSNAVSKLVQSHLGLILLLQSRGVCVKKLPILRHTYSGMTITFNLEIGDLNTP